MPTYSISDEEHAIFQARMQGVTPLKTTKKLPPIITKTTPHVEPNKPQKNHKPTISFHPHKTHCEAVNSNSILSYVNQQLSIKHMQNLKNGEIHYEAKLDLHGLTAEEATNRMLTFIGEQCALKHRCLLIIHGKGSMYGEEPILKNHVNQLLRNIPQILAFHSALNKHGGTGALYVLLKRNACHLR